ncbi:hypothetical protein E3A20_21510 [Planctomyces bekefii]|uniref:HTH luxR-type domain-containing protein n=1 Tax=Planctomyces bekefii TaxID=1653850 RepID=A0A5C6M6Q8_9PLAN|nr:hypothetical protein E3A20_21510 [Planctomyces bekefii]
MRHPTSVFASEIQGFIALTRLSPRESQILRALIQNVTNSVEIGKSLGISTHTVNNHLKSIFEKTSTNSKTEILASFLRFAADQMKAENLFARRPRVLLVSDRQRFADNLASHLMDRGLKPYISGKSKSVTASISVHGCDLVLIDYKSTAFSGMEILKQVRASYLSWPYALIVGCEPGIDAKDWLHHGASGVIDDLADVDAIFRAIMAALPSDRGEKSLSKAKALEQYKLGNEIFEVSASDLGFGGVFIELHPSVMLRKSVEVGTIMDVRLRLQDLTETILVRGEVAWKRSENEEEYRSGIGLRFVRLAQEDQMVVSRYLDNYAIASYIPNGEFPGSQEVQKIAL